MWYFLLLLSSSAITFEEKENFCYILATRSLRERKGEIADHIKLHPHLSEPAIKPKLLEDAFYTCMGEKSLDDIPEDSQIFNSYSNYASFAYVPLEKYTTFQDLKLTPEFTKKKGDILRMSMMKPRLLVPDL
ncbi:hypothetical protein SteCoe_14356 [Stentor coeruleus]|uniref:Uncharacterized protein n=1 Tax=Stentor coeruleus TaxID=5963 RepID=A0A1R2C6A3_9CILI|nr:hypothetical protein SteCoe_14356 [Stentor coeruleus]